MSIMQNKKKKRKRKKRGKKRAGIYSKRVKGERFYLQ